MALPIGREVFRFARGWVAGGYNWMVPRQEVNHGDEADLLAAAREAMTALPDHAIFATARRFCIALVEPRVAIVYVPHLPQDFAEALTLGQMLETIVVYARML